MKLKLITLFLFVTMLCCFTIACNNDTSTTEDNNIEIQDDISNVKVTFTPGGKTSDAYTLTGSIKNGYTFTTQEETKDTNQATLIINLNTKFEKNKSYEFSFDILSAKDLNKASIKIGSSSSTAFVYKNKLLNIPANTKTSFDYKFTATTGVKGYLTVDLGITQANVIKLTNIKLEQIELEPITTSAEGADTTAVNQSLSEDSSTTIIIKKGTETTEIYNGQNNFGLNRFGENEIAYIAKNKTDSSKYTTLVWSDEFNGDSLDTTNTWTYQKDADTQDPNNKWGNHEHEIYTEGENAKVLDGCLNITAKTDYTSTRINTSGKVSFKYGKLVARMRFDKETGSWPAFWMMGGHNTGWPQCGEIDIMEHTNTNVQVANTLHWNKKGIDALYSDDCHSYKGGNSLKECGTIDVKEWHEYGIIWTENKIQAIVDDIVTYEWDIGINAGPGLNCFTDDTFYFLINYAIGGDYANVHSGFTNLPWNMYVDWVRVWQ